MSTPWQLAVADVRLEEEDRRSPVAPFVGVAEVLERLTDDAEQGGDGVAALVGLVDGGAAEDDAGERVASAAGSSPASTATPNG